MMIGRFKLQFRFPRFRFEKAIVDPNNLDYRDKADCIRHLHVEFPTYLNVRTLNNGLYVLSIVVSGFGFGLYDYSVD